MQEIFVKNTTILEFEIIEEANDYLWLYDDLRNINLKLTKEHLLITWKSFWRKKNQKPFDWEWVKHCRGEWVSRDRINQSDKAYDVNTQAFLKSDPTKDDYSIRGGGGIEQFFVVIWYAKHISD